MTADILIATHNPGKRVEIHSILTGFNLPELRLLLPAELGIRLDVKEDGATYAENAMKKALAFCRASGMLTLADDSGLEVEALGGAPGLHSARYTGFHGASDAQRRAFLLHNLAGIPRPWDARFVCTVALAAPGEQMIDLFEGECRGEIIPEERGTRGFGYDPVFYIPAAGATMAELGLEEKNAISHRGRALQAARARLSELLETD